MDTLKPGSAGGANLHRPLQLSIRHWELMCGDVDQRAPEEACGLLSGIGGRVEAVYPLTNILHSPVRYRIDPEEQWQVFQQNEQQGWDLVAIYHSHPDGPNKPSQTDIEEAYYPEAFYLIWSRIDEDWTCSAFRIQNGNITQVEIVISREE